MVDETGGTTGGGGSDVAVGLTIGSGKLRTTVGWGVLVGPDVAVGRRVFVGVGSAGVGVVKLGVGIKLGKVAVGVTVGDGVKVGVGGEMITCSTGNSKKKTNPIKVSVTSPIRSEITIACDRFMI